MKEFRGDKAALRAFEGMEGVKECLVTSRTDGETSSVVSCQ